MAVTFDSLPPVQHHRKPSPDRLVITADGALWRTGATTGPWWLVSPPEVWTPLTRAHALIATHAWKIDARRGLIISSKTGNQLATPLVNSYPTVSVRLPGKGPRRVGVHRVIWSHVHGPIEPTLQIDHINDDKLDASIANLQAVTPATNNALAIASGLRTVTPLHQSTVDHIRELAATYSTGQIAALLHLPVKRVRRVITRATYTSAA